MIPQFSNVCAGIRLAKMDVMCKCISRSLLLVACAAMLSACSGSGLPSSPSALTPLTAPGTGGARLRTLDDPPVPPVPPTPDPNAAVPTPMQVIIGIIGYYGPSAFMPNPIQANVGDAIVWTNNDTRLHHIVLDDGTGLLGAGTDLGDVQPGQSSAPVTLTTPTAMFHCTIHPTMIGSINGMLPPDPYMPPDDNYGYY